MYSAAVKLLLPPLSPGKVNIPLSYFTVRPSGKAISPVLLLPALYFMDRSSLYAASYSAALSAIDLNAVSKAPMRVVGVLITLPIIPGKVLPLAASASSNLLYLASVGISFLNACLNNWAAFMALVTDAAC